MRKKRNIKMFLVVTTLFVLPTSFLLNSKPQKEQSEFLEEKQNQPPVIKQVIVSGNKYVAKDVILNRIPYKVGQNFDAFKSSQAIHNIYALGYFNQIEIKKELLPNNEIKLHVIVEERKLPEKIEIKGNKAIKTDKIMEDLNLHKLATIDEETMQQIAQAIKKMYAKENYHTVQVSTELIPNSENPDKATAIFKIKEGPQTTVTRVFFVGNKNLPDRKLSTIIFTREDWLLGFLDGAGEYQADALELDKHRIEYFYKDNGYLMATVANTNVEFYNDNKDVHVTFHIKEGDRFTIKSVHAIGDDLFKEKELLEYVTLEEGEPYNQSKLVESLNNLKSLWGNKGYIYADVYPQVKPNEDTNEVDITFNVEKGKKFHVDRIVITGNRVTQDKVIRRQLDISEGDLITTRKLNSSQSNVEYLSFFERGGVNWKIHRISDEKANLEMNIKETKTGSLNIGLNYGTDKNSAQQSLRGNVKVEKKNLMGMGWDVGGMVEANRHTIKALQAHFFDPSIFDTDVSGGIHFYKRWQEYDQWNDVNKTPKESTTGGQIRFGFQLPKIDKRLQLLLEFGIEDIRNNHPQAIGENRIYTQALIEKAFQEGTLNWITVDLSKDTRNHQVYPNKGYKLLFNTKTALPFTNQEYGFFKAEFDASCYNALIGTDWLVLALHAKAGTICDLGGHDNKTKKSKIIPYKELFHMGGQNTVRGFTWGSIGPAFNNDPLGGKHAIQFNAELIFPLIPDYSMKAHVFYDAGAGWNAPNYPSVDKNRIIRNKFNLRHSVGFGLNLLKPTPAKIDWGYKLDRNKKAGESPSEFHISMNYAW